MLCGLTGHETETCLWPVGSGIGDGTVMRRQRVREVNHLTGNELDVLIFRACREVSVSGCNLKAPNK